MVPGIFACGSIARQSKILGKLTSLLVDGRIVLLTVANTAIEKSPEVQGERELVPSSLLQRNKCGTNVWVPSDGIFREF